jgi:hypothetical protein
LFDLYLEEAITQTAQGFYVSGYEGWPSRYVKSRFGSFSEKVLFIFPLMTKEIYLNGIWGRANANAPIKLCHMRLDFLKARELTYRTLWYPLHTWILIYPWYMIRLRSGTTFSFSQGECPIFGSQIEIAMPFTNHPPYGRIYPTV